MASAEYGGRLRGPRPEGLRLTTLRRTWYRIDAEPAARWSWAAYPQPRNRFDPATGAARVRYAGDEERGAMRERFDLAQRRLRARDLDLQFVVLTGAVSVLDLRRDRILDALGLDDQISTSRAPDVWHACQRLTDLVIAWFGRRCHGIVYRSRTTPQRSANLAFFEWAPLRAHSSGPLRDQPALLDACALYEGFAIQGRR